MAYRLLLCPLLLAVATLATVSSQTVPTDIVVPSRVSLPPSHFTDSVPDTEAKWEMVYIPGGEFLMGSPEDEPGRKPDEGPQHKVQVRPFWIGKCEVTWDEFYSFWKDEDLLVGDKPESLPEEFKNIGPDALTRPTNTFVDELYDHGRDGHPALCMTHHAAMMYCEWLRWKTKKPYRLPTEAEWEYACRAGSTGPYGFDGGEDQLGDYAWYKENSADDDHPDGTTHPVGSKKPNAFGVHDMHGNVAEWVLDHYDPHFYEKFAKLELAFGPVNRPTSKKWSHVVRGGSWADKPDRLRSAARRGSDKSWIKHDPQLPTSIWWLTKMDVIGFRVALPVEEYPDLIGLKPMVMRQPD
jgi:formylglycine-generating enzyme required for sulfatase activity